MRFLILSAVALPLAACAGETIGPSLAKRLVESRSSAEPVREVAAPPAAGAALAAEIAGLLERAETGRRDFAALLPRAESAAAASGAESSESWITAQQLLSALEAARAESTRALAELDARTVAGLNGGGEAGLVELQAANARVTAIVEEQNAALERLRGRIAG